VHELIAKLVDHATLGIAVLMHAESGPRPPRRAAAAELLARPDFFAPDLSDAIPVFRNEHDFTFASPVTTGNLANDVVHGRLFRAGSQLAARPVVVLLHGWNDEFGYQLRQPALARRFTERGIHCAMLELPYHLHRRPKAPPAIRDFISGDLAAMIAATHQALAEHRALFGFLEKSGCTRIALWGYSLGGWLAGLLACHDPRVDTLVLSTPMSDIGTTIQHLPFCRTVRSSLRQEPLDLSGLNLTQHRPFPPAERRLLQVGEHDQFIPKATLDELWKEWERPLCRIEPHGHMSILGSPRILRETVDWLAARLIRRP
jgi:hypothetical protein